MILIISNSKDKHVDFVVARLQERNIVYWRFDTDSFPQRTAIHLGFNDGVLISKLLTHEGEIDLQNVTSVWYRKPVSPVIDDVIMNPVAREFSELEAKTSLEYLWDMIPGKWVNDIHAMRRANNRFRQWQIAHELGFRTPMTVLTNSPMTAHTFVAPVGKKIALKVLYQTVVANGTDICAMYTRLCDDAVIAKLDDIRFTPSILQEYVEKRVEHRVTVIGDQVFDCIIESQATKKTSVDWRRYDLKNTPHRIGKLPDSVTQRCLAITQKLGLLFGGIDLIETPEGEYVFLEINSNPQWAWIEVMTGIPLCDALIELLT